MKGKGKQQSEWNKNILGSILPDILTRKNILDVHPGRALTLDFHLVLP